MFDFSLTEMLLAGTVALIVLGPERLPKVARTIGLWVGKVQTLTTNIKSELSVQAEFNELNKIKSEMEHAAWEMRDGLHGLKEDLHLPAWERLPEQKTPEDFGIMPPKQYHFSGSLNHGTLNPSLHKQAMLRKRDRRPRYHPTPKLRSRR